MADFTPRLTKDGMLNSKYWYSNTNPFYPAGYGLPNCTCYAWGRFWEISDVIPHLPAYDGGQWWDNVSGYEKGSTPQLGAVMCFSQPGASGHVCIVEEIKSNGDVVSSNSGYSRNPGGYDDPQYFWTETNPASSGYRSSWEISGNYQFQGFIYNPEQPIPPHPSFVYRKMPIWMYLKRKI